MLKLTCPCCDKTQPWKRQHRLPAGIFGEAYYIVTCPSCGCGATIPAPRSAYNHYRTNERYTMLFEQQAALYKAFAVQLLGILDRIPNHKATRLLDVGCGGGFLVQAATEQGFEAVGLEANDELVVSAQKRGINVIQGDLHQLNGFENAYDVIVLSAVLEHLEHPEVLLSGCKKFLSSHGVIVLSQASFDGLLPRLFPWGWYAWQPHEHYWHFTPGCFKLFLMKTGFEEIYLRRNSLHHRCFAHGGSKELIGRNIAYAISSFGTAMGMGDSFDVLVRPNGLAE